MSTSRFKLVAFPSEDHRLAFVPRRASDTADDSIFLITSAYSNPEHFQWSMNNERRSLALDRD